MGQVFCFASISEELLFPTMKIRFLSNYKGKRHTLHVKYLTFDTAGELSPSAPSPLRGEGWGKNAPGEHYKGRRPLDSPAVSHSERIQIFIDKISNIHVTSFWASLSSLILRIL
jgi:hypothetical protein